MFLPCSSPCRFTFDFSPPTAESFGVSAQIGSGVVRGKVPRGFHQGSTRAAGWCEHQNEHRMLLGISPELILFACLFVSRLVLFSHPGVGPQILTVSNLSQGVQPICRQEGGALSPASSCSPLSPSLKERLGLKLTLDTASARAPDIWGNGSAASGAKERRVGTRSFLGGREGGGEGRKGGEGKGAFHFQGPRTLRTWNGEPSEAQANHRIPVHAPAPSAPSAPAPASV